MSCTNPKYGYIYGTDENGKKKISFKVHGQNVAELKALYGKDLVAVPCGHCISCQLSHAKEWAVRCVLESLEYQDNMFLTLTYDDKHCPCNGFLIKSDLQKFMKRLRKSCPEKKIRFFACGEHGTLNGRPHYHVIIFNHCFDDLEYLKDGESGERIYTSKTLSKLWPYGISSVGEVTVSSCGYVARYSNKKTGSRYPDDFIVMSRKPGIAAQYCLDNMETIYLVDHVYGNFGKVHEAGVPRYFDKLAEKQGKDISDIKESRIARGEAISELALKLHDSVDQLDLDKIRNSVLISKLKALKRYI